MNSWRSAAYRIGSWSTLAIIFLAAAYLIIGAVWIAGGEYQPGQAFSPAEPFLTLLRICMLLLVLPILVLFATIYAFAAEDKKVYGLVAFGFSIILAAVTCVNNLLLVTILRQPNEPIVPRIPTMLPDLWRAVLLPLELLAWGPVFGLAMLFAAPVFTGDRLPTAIRIGFFLGGALCMANVLCFVTGDLRFSVAGIIGYDFVFPVTCVLLATFFWREKKAAQATAENL